MHSRNTVTVLEDDVIDPLAAGDRSAQLLHITCPPADSNVAVKQMIRILMAFPDDQKPSVAAVFQLRMTSSLDVVPVVAGHSM
jgi:hypothetical protein